MLTQTPEGANGGAPGETQPKRAEGILDLLAQRWPQAVCELDYRTRFEYLVAVVLSAQTTDQRVNQVTPTLFEYAPDAAHLSALSRSRLESYLKPLGLQRKKAELLHGLATAILTRHKGLIPETAAELKKLPGVGQKTANLYLSQWTNQPKIAVDTHVFRVARRLGLSQARTPSALERDLSRQLPPARYAQVNTLLVWHGRYLCRARRPGCAECLLRLECPSSTAPQNGQEQSCIESSAHGITYSRPLCQNSFSNTTHTSSTDSDSRA